MGKTDVGRTFAAADGRLSISFTDSVLIGSPDGTTGPGHVIDACVPPTLEVLVTVDPVAMHKRK
jgi:hypothetical protein